MSKITISESVKKMRSESGLPASSFAKYHKLSRPLLAKYEKGEYDCPTPQIAANFCNIFHLEADEFMIDYRVSNKANFNEKDFYDAVCYIMYKEEYQSYSELFNKKTSKLLGLNKGQDTYIAEYSKGIIPCECIFTNKNNEKIGFFYFPYKKVQRDNPILSAYPEFTKTITDIIFRPLKIQISKTKTISTIRSYLLVTPSKDAFKAIIEEYKDNYFRYKNNRPIESSASPVNITILHLPRWGSESLKYYTLTGKDFISINDYKCND